MVLSSFRKLRIWQLFRLYELQQRVPKQKLIISVVKTMLQFVQIGVEMFDRQLVICADDRAFEQAPNVLNAVDVNIYIYPLLFGVFHCAVSGAALSRESQ
jgi:hypothetical protein